MKGPLATDVLKSYRTLRVLVTGHTGFKGSWLTAWLHALGADVTGFALEPDQGPDNLFQRADLAGSCRSRIGDVRDLAAVREAFDEACPNLVIHLAAQPLVQRSYADPVGTIATNVLGTAHVLEAARKTSTVRAIVCVTTDKVYRNRELARGYVESDELGGYDPYSASKGAAEMVARSYRTALAPKDRPFALACVRGGNVLGGGDWSADRLVPDMVRALRANETMEIRYPDGIRPWQHVLDLCYAYLLIGFVLLDSDTRADIDAWNIGPDPRISISVRALADLFFEAWDAPTHSIKIAPSTNFESRTLALDSSLAQTTLGWTPMLGPEETIRMTSEWYRAYLDAPETARALVDAQRIAFEHRLAQHCT